MTDALDPKLIAEWLALHDAIDPSDPPGEFNANEFAFYGLSHAMPAQVRALLRIIKAQNYQLTICANMLQECLSDFDPEWDQVHSARQILTLSAPLAELLEDKS